MSRSTCLSSMSALALLGLSHLAGCGNTVDEPTSSDRLLALSACGLNDGTVDVSADLRACDPQDPKKDAKKTTICHIPPGNPANAHTICVGNAAVPAHLRNHGDHVGACVSETPCPPPPTTGTGGATGGGAGSGGAPMTTPDSGVVIVP